MSFTFDITNNIGKTRFWIADCVNTTEAPAIFSDEEIQYALDLANQRPLWARIYLAETRCALDGANAGIGVDVGDIQISNAASAGKNWCELATQWRFQMSNGLAPESDYNPFFYAGGIYQEDTNNWEDNINNDIYTKRSFWNNYNDLHDESSLSGGDDE